MICCSFVGRKAFFSLTTSGPWTSLPTEIAKKGKKGVCVVVEKQLFPLLVQNTAVSMLLLPSRCCRLWSRSWHWEPFHQLCWAFCQLIDTLMCVYPMPLLGCAENDPRQLPGLAINYSYNALMDSWCRNWISWRVFFFLFNATSEEQVWAHLLSGISSVVTFSLAWASLLHLTWHLERIQAEIWPWRGVWHGATGSSWFLIETPLPAIAGIYPNGCDLLLCYHACLPRYRLWILSGSLSSSVW